MRSKKSRWPNQTISVPKELVRDLKKAADGQRISLVKYTELALRAFLDGKNGPQVQLPTGNGATGKLDRNPKEQNHVSQ